MIKWLLLHVSEVWNSLLCSYVVLIRIVLKQFDCDKQKGIHCPWNTHTYTLGQPGGHWLQTFKVQVAECLIEHHFWNFWTYEWPVAMWMHRLHEPSNVRNTTRNVVQIHCWYPSIHPPIHPYFYLKSNLTKLSLPLLCVMHSDRF